MKTSRGRLSQYKILHAEESLSNHLLEREQFSKESLFKLLEKYNTVAIKPSFGPGDLTILLVNSQYKIISQNKVVTFTNKEDMYQYIKQNEMKQKYYVIQPRFLTSFLFQGPSQYFVTVHRKSSLDKWYFASITDNISSVGNFFDKYFLKKYKSISILAAQKLGEYFPECNTIVIEIISDFKRGIWIYDTILHLPISKWDQYQTLREEREIASFVPQTNLLTNAVFISYLKKFNEIIIKPCTGQHGIGIVKVKRIDHSHYEIHSGIRKVTKQNLNDTYRYIQDICQNTKDYIIQQRVKLATIDGCPMDVRVITQKVYSAWNVTGKIIKVAGKNFFITNATQKLLSFDEGIQDSTISHLTRDSLEEEMDRICTLAARHLYEKNIKLTIIGFDIGITDRGDIWIIEGNYTPDLSMFKLMEDEKMYMNIMNARKELR
ncbi:YheC/YheD family protein [Psychrobacillus sp. L4]|uniref:YheC/YheD family protein n=1 Tax=Psychrobacillus sp. L4 TaxID=3236892 RepID=UPI0036F2ADB7